MWFLTGALFLTFALLGCSGGGGGFEVKPPFFSNDFRKSEIKVLNSGLADGQTELTFTIILRNSNDSYVSGFRPIFEVVSGTGVTTGSCVKSNSSGVANCILKSNLSGIKIISVKNIDIKLEGNLTFNAPSTPSSEKPVVGLISAKSSQSSGNFSLTASVGSQEPGIVQTSGNYKLYGGIEGVENSK